MTEKEAPSILTVDNLRNLLLVIFSYIIEALAFFLVLTVGFGLEVKTFWGASGLYVGGRLIAYLLKLVARS
jgi:hypothetical protein